MTTQIQSQDVKGGAVAAENVSTADLTIPANTSVLISSDYEIGNGFVTEIGTSSTLEIT